MTTEMRSLIVGSHFVPGAKAFLAALPSGTPLRLDRERDNPYDENAIWVSVHRDNIVWSSELVEALAGYGIGRDEAEQQEWHHLGHLAASGGKPLLLAREQGLGELVGTLEVLGAEGALGAEWRLEFWGDGKALVVMGEASE